MSMEKIAQYRKAIAALLAPGIIQVIASLQGTSDGGATITISEWLWVVLAVLGTSALVSVVPNALTVKQTEQVWVKAKDMIALGEMKSTQITNADKQAALARAGKNPA